MCVVGVTCMITSCIYFMRATAGILPKPLGRDSTLFQADTRTNHQSAKGNKKAAHC